MILSLVTYPAASLSPPEARQLIESVAPRFLEIDGLGRKYFVSDADQAGGVYVWDDQASADAYFDDAWKSRMKLQYGAVPSVKHYDCSCIVDRLSGINLADPG